MADNQNEYVTYDGVIVGISPEAIKSVALETGDWLLGTVQGCFNEKMTVSQIVVDALIGMVPLVGDVTAVRDLIAVLLGLCKNPQKREQAMEWALLVVLILALIPVAGGVVKGVGRLALQGAKTAGKKHALLKDIIMFLNRMGEGNAVKFIKELNVMKYQRDILSKFKEVTELLHSACGKIVSRFWVPKSIKDRLYWFQSCLSELHRLGSKMIPEGLKELNTHLKEIQKAVYQGEFHMVASSGKVVTRETEARLMRRRGVLPTKNKDMKYPQVPVTPDMPEQILEKYYKHQKDWADLSKYLSEDKKTYKYITPFCGKINPSEVKAGDTIVRVVELGNNYITSPWWVRLEQAPKNAKEYRELRAVLDEFGHNGWIVTCKVPQDLKVWEGTTASQINQKIGQYLEGGGTQLWVDLGKAKEYEKEMTKAFCWGKTSFTTKEGFVFTIRKTGWSDAVGIWGFGEELGRSAMAAQQLGKYERQSKVAAAGARVAHGTQTQK